MSVGTLWNRGPSAWGAATASPGAGGWDLLLISTAALLLTAVARLHLLVQPLALLRPVLLAGGLAVVLYALDVHPRRRPGALRSPGMACMLGLALWAVLSVPAALREARSFVFLIDDFLKTVLLVVLVAGAPRDTRDVERLAFTYFAGAAVYALFVLARFDVGGGSWRLTELYTYDPNDFATFAVTALPLGLYFAVRSGGLRRALTLLGAVALGTAFVWAGSRGGFLALLGVILFLLLRYRAVAARWRLAATALLAMVVVGVASERYWEQMATMLEPAQDYNLTAETGRLQVWKRGVGYMLDDPLFGVGPDNFPVAEGVLSPHADRQQYGAGVRWTAPHNSLVQVGAELGVPGLLLFLALIAATFRMLGAVAGQAALNGEGEPDPRSLAQALTASLIGFLIGAFFLSLAYSPILYAPIGLALALGKVTLAAPRGGPARVGATVRRRVATRRAILARRPLRRGTGAHTPGTASADGR